MTSQQGLFIVCVKYPERTGFKFGSNTPDLESAVYRIHDHADVYGDHEDAEAYAFNADTQKVVLRFKGGTTPGGKARTICVTCHRTVLKHHPYQVMCPNCRVNHDRGNQ